jgi:hypothetical protein
MSVSEHEHIQETVIGLPDGVGCLSFPTMQEIEALVVGLRPLMSQCRQRRRKLTHKVIDEPIAWRLHLLLTRQRTDLSVDGGHAEWWCLEGKAFDELAPSKGQTTMSASAGPALAHQTGQPLGSIARDPSLQGPKRPLVLAGEVRQVD